MDIIFFPEDFLDSLPDDYIVSSKMLTDRFKEMIKGIPHEVKLRDPIYTQYLEAYGTGEALRETYNLNVVPRALGQDPAKNVESIESYFSQMASIAESARISSSVLLGREKLARRLIKAFSYEFSDGDLTKVQQLVNQVRDLIQQSTLFEAEHKSRLLKRLERLQIELHKKVSDLDRFWGLIGDAGVVLGKFGNDAKPIVDRATIVWVTQLRAEGLPSNCPSPLPLPAPHSETGSPERLPIIDV
jgi:hypothetical protein